MQDGLEGVPRPLNIAYVGATRSWSLRWWGSGLMASEVCRMICDYFFPKVGGVESHIYSLAEALAKLDHKVSNNNTTQTN